MTPCPVKATSHEPHEILLPWLHSEPRLQSHACSSTFVCVTWVARVPAAEKDSCPRWISSVASPEPSANAPRLSPPGWHISAWEHPYRLSCMSLYIKQTHLESQSTRWLTSPEFKGIVPRRRRVMMGLWAAANTATLRWLPSSSTARRSLPASQAKLSTKPASSPAQYCLIA